MRTIKHIFTYVMMGTSSYAMTPIPEDNDVGNRSTSFANMIPVTLFTRAYSEFEINVLRPREEQYYIDLTTEMQGHIDDTFSFAIEHSERTQTTCNYVRLREIMRAHFKTEIDRKQPDFVFHINHLFYRHLHMNAATSAFAEEMFASSLFFPVKTTVDVRLKTFIDTLSTPLYTFPDTQEQPLREESGE